MTLERLWSSQRQPDDYKPCPEKEWPETTTTTTTGLIMTVIAQTHH